MMKPIDIYKRGLKDGVDFCVKILTDMPISDPVVRDVFNTAAKSIEKNFREIIVEYDLDHSAKEKR